MFKKFKITMMIIGGLALLSLSQNAYSKNSYQKLSFDNLPSLASLEESALNYAGLHPKRIHSWERKSKLAVLLPRLQIGFDRGSQSENTAIIQDSISVTSSGVTVGPETNRIDQDLNTKYAFEVKAVWALDELLFNRNQLLISREARDLFVTRSRLLQQVHGSYFKLKTLLLENQFDLQTQVKIEQLASRLNSLTGGDFLRSIQNSIF